MIWIGLFDYGGGGLVDMQEKLWAWLLERREYLWRWSICRRKMVGKWHPLLSKWMPSSIPTWDSLPLYSSNAMSLIMVCESLCLFFFWVNFIEHYSNVSVLLFGWVGDLTAAFEKHVATYGGLDICVNNAGINNSIPFQKDQTDGTPSYKRTLNVNLIAVIDCTRLAVWIQASLAFLQ